MARFRRTHRRSNFRMCRRTPTFPRRMVFRTIRLSRPATSLRRIHRAFMIMPAIKALATAVSRRRRPHPDWDPGAKSDMQALEDVFDTNHDSALDAGDADFNDFYVMVTNPDGTETAYSLAQRGITSINLTPDATNSALPDGSRSTANRPTRH